MDGRGGMSLQGPASYYLNRGGIGGSSGSGPASNVRGGGGGGGGGSATAQGGGIHAPPVFKTLSDPNISVHPNVAISGGAVGGPAFHVENPSPNYPHGMSMSVVWSASQGGEIVGKKKRVRPRKYGPDGAKMSVGLSPVSASKPSSEPVTPGEKPRRGRPPGTGWKQKLAPLGEWMNSSAGLAYTPHVLHIGVGEDVAAKILAFAQQRPRALCILSGSGSVSALTLRQPTNSDATVTYEGIFEILCLSGSYLLAENGGPPNRTGGISISVCSPDGHLIGGAIGGRLIAASHVQVVACSFVYGGTKAKNEAESETADEKHHLEQSAEKSLTPVSVAPSQSLTPNSGPSVWPLSSRLHVKNPESEIDLMCG